MTYREPQYIALYRSGDLERRAQALEARLASCDICPRECRINRLEDKTGSCSSGRLPIVSSFCAHKGEEPAISGIKGSGTIFFGNCNMKCLYCQNYQISQHPSWQKSKEVDCHTLAENMIYLQQHLGCHNINFVSPSHFVPQLVRAILEAIPMGLRVPLIYNTNGYDSLASLRALEGIIDIYLPDLRYASDDLAEKYSGTADYVLHSRQAIREMNRQVGNLEVDESGLAQKGLIVRHLILPNDLAGSRESLSWLAGEVGSQVTVSIMSQYMPMYRAPREPLLSRPITKNEYGSVVRLLDELGLENGWIQEMGAEDNYLPDFKREGHPFDVAFDRPDEPAPGEGIQ